MQNQSLSEPPFNTEAEQIVLGDIISNGVLHEVDESQFYFENHKKIFKKLKELKTIDIVTLSGSFNSEELQSVGGRAYLAKIVNESFGHKVKGALEILKENSDKRKIREKILRAEDKIRKDDYNIGEIVEDIYNEIREQRLQTEDGDEVVQIKELAYSQKTSFTEKYKTQFKIFDDALDGGFKSGDLIIVSAPTGFGKTTLSQNFTYFLSNQGLPCLWFSYEVLGTHLYKKFEEMGLKDGSAHYIPLKHTSGSIDWVESKIIEAKKNFYCKFVVIDHLGFLLPRRGGVSQTQNYSAYLGQIARDLKLIAIEQEVAIILPVHMRKTDDPKINDIRDSSGIAQEADTIFTIKREVNPNDMAQSEYTDYSQITLAKNRTTGRSVKAWFQLKNNIFCHEPHYVPHTQKQVPKF